MSRSIYWWPWFSKSRVRPRAWVFFFQFYIYLLFIFNWRITALQYCVSFCHTPTWFSHRYAYVFICLTLPLPTPSHPSRLSQSPRLSSLSQFRKFPLSTLYMVVDILPCYCLHSSQPLLVPLSPHAHESVLYVCISIAALQIGSSGPSF